MGIYMGIYSYIYIYVCIYIVSGIWEDRKILENPVSKAINSWKKTAGILMISLTKTDILWHFSDDICCFVWFNQQTWGLNQQNWCNMVQLDINGNIVGVLWG